MSFLRNALLILLVLSQAMFTAAGGSLVLCVEPESTTQFEFLSGTCCDVDVAQSGEGADLSQAFLRATSPAVTPEPCESCEDQRLIAAALERHDCPVPAPWLAAGFWNSVESPGIVEGVVARPVEASRYAGRRGPHPGGPGLLVRDVLKGVVLRC